MLTKLGVVAVGFAAVFLSTVDVSGTVGLGSILVGMLVTILAGGFSLRARLKDQQIAGWRGNYQQEKEHAEQLEQRLIDSQKLIDQIRKELADARVTIERLQQLPNLERLVQLMSDIQERQEQRAQGRHLEVLGAITGLTQKT